jgi:hypothetical protein
MKLKTAVHRVIVLQRIERSMAARVLQRWWNRYLTEKRASIHVLRVRALAKFNVAATTIQQWWRLVSAKVKAGKSKYLRALAIKTVHVQSPMQRRETVLKKIWDSQEIALRNISPFGKQQKLPKDLFTLLQESQHRKPQNGRLNASSPKQNPKSVSQLVSPPRAVAEGPTSRSPTGAPALQKSTGRDRGRNQYTSTQFHPKPKWNTDPALTPPIWRSPPKDPLPPLPPLARKRKLA